MTSRSTGTRAHARFNGARFNEVRFIGAAVAAVVIVAALFIGSALTGPLATTSPPTSAPAVTAGLDYVALGDSYSTGLGLTPLTGLPTPECAQSSANFPHLVAAARGLNLTDVTCSGAETGDITVDGQYGSIAPQIAALSADTDVVTLTIGGNDLGFSKVVQSCLAKSADGPLLIDDRVKNCAAAFTAQGDLLDAAIDGPVSMSLAKTYAAVAAAAPNAMVFVVGYPSIFPETVPAAGCFTALGSAADTFPFTDVDVPYLHSVEVKLDATIQKAAAAAGFTYVPTFAASFGHDACVTDGSAFVNGIRTAGGDPDPSGLHPNTLGATFLADSVLALYRAS